jgi:hypothetical protein
MGQMGQTGHSDSRGPGSALDRRTFVKIAGVGAVGISSGLAGCVGGGGGGRSFPPEDRTEWGQERSLGDGTTKPFVTTDSSGATEMVGVYMTKDVLNEDGLPTEVTEVHFDVPSGSPFGYAGVDWNPEGHEPPGIYTVPHFDFHFYMIGHDRVDAIEAGPATYPIPDDQVPVGYVRPPAIDTNGDGELDTPGVVPQMGEHLVDPTSPEFQGEPFTYTFIWGAYNVEGDVGQLTFMEPMVTRAFLLDLNGEIAPDIEMPAAFRDAGTYPTRYVIRNLAEQDAYVVALDNFEQFPASTT